MKALVRRGIPAAILILTLALGVCSSPQAHMQDLKDRVLQSYTTSQPDRLYYIGSDKTYDYYYLQNEDKRYKVLQSETTQFPKMNVTEDRSQWQVVSPASTLDGSVLDTQ